MNKKQILERIQGLPENASTADIMEELFFREQVEKGLQDIQEGRVLTHEELKARIAKWRRSAGQ